MHEDECDAASKEKREMKRMSKVGRAVKKKRGSIEEDQRACRRARGSKSGSSSPPNKAVKLTTAITSTVSRGPLDLCRQITQVVHGWLRILARDACGENNVVIEHPPDDVCWGLQVVRWSSCATSTMRPITYFPFMHNYYERAGS
jgi:hypothetical protein